MRLLFAADLHGDQRAFDRYAELLAGHDAGVLAGDLLEEFATPAEALRHGVLDELPLEELTDEGDEDRQLTAAIRRALNDPASVNRRTIEARRTALQDQLTAAGRPVFLVTGNHDLSRWPDRGLVTNLEGRQVSFGGLVFAGLADRFHKGRSLAKYSRRQLEALRGTDVLVTHSPPWKVLDLGEGSRAFLKYDRKLRPRLHLFGHVHRTAGRQGPFVNGAWATRKRFASLHLTGGGFTVEWLA